MNHDYLLASRWQRFCAQFVDGFLLCLPIWLSIFLDTAFKMRDQFIIVGALSALLVGSYNFYLFVCTGQTLGKKQLGIEAISMHGVPLTAGARFARSLAALVMSMLGWINLIDIGFIFGEQRRTLHDRLVGSVVVVKGSRRTLEDEMPDVGFSRF